MVKRLQSILSGKFEKDTRCEGVEIPCDFEIKPTLEAIISKSGIEKRYIHINVSNDKKLKEKMFFNKHTTYLQMLKRICLNNQLDIYLDDNGIFVME